MALHEKYGEVVRIHPEELSFISPSAWQDIYASRPQLPKPKIGTLEVRFLVVTPPQNQVGCVVYNATVGY